MSNPKVTIRVAQRGAKETAAQVERVADAQRDVARESEAAAKALERQAAAASRSTTAAKAAAAATDSVAGGASSATATIGNLSESLDKGLENSVGRAFKATDRLTSIIGQATGALGLASLAVTGLTTVYTLATKALNQNTKEQEYANSIRNQATREIDAYLAAYAKMPHATAQQVAEHVKETAAIERANKNRAKAASLLQAAKDARTAALVSIKRHKEELQRGVRDYRRYMKVLHELPIAQKRLAQAEKMVRRAVEGSNAATQVYNNTLDKSRKRQLRAAQASLQLERAWSRFGGAASKVGRGLLDVAAPGIGRVVDLVSDRRAQAAAGEFGAKLRAMLELDFDKAADGARRAADAFETLIQKERRIKGVFADFDAAIGRAFSIYDEATRDEFAEFTAALEGLVPVAQRTGAAIRNALGLGRDDPGEPSDIGKRADELSKFSDAFEKALSGLSKGERAAAVGAIEATASASESLTRGLSNAAGAALVYGESFGEIARQALASLAAQATSEALFQTAKGLAFLAASYFDPRAALAAKAAFGSAAAFGAIAALTVPAARASGSASGGGGGGGGSTAITEPTPADFGEPEQRERQDSEMFINFASGQSGRPVSRADAGAIVGALVDLARSGGYRLEARRA